MKGETSKNVLVVISTMGQFPEMFRIAQQLQDSSEFHPIIYFNMGGGNHPSVSDCLDAGFDVLDYVSGFTKGKSRLSRTTDTDELITTLKTARQRRQKFKHYVKYNMPALFSLPKEVGFFFYRVALKLKRYKKEAQFFDLLNIKLMIFAEDSEDYFTPQLIELGHSRNIRSVVVPYTFANQFEFLEDAYFFDRRVNKNILNFLTAKLFPKWTYKYKGKTLLKSFPSVILSSEIFRLSSPNPWVMSSGFSDVFAVESQFMKEYYSKAGIPEAKIVETGYPSLDHLHRIHHSKAEYKTKLATKLGLDAEKPWIACAVPPTQWPRAAAGYKTYEQFLEDYFEFFASFEGAEILFKFHPRINPSMIKRLCAQHKIKYVAEDTIELIPLSDMYVASVSSTIRWALALGLPTINYDLYNYNYGDFDTAENYSTVVKFEEFKKTFSDEYHKLIHPERDGRSLHQAHFAVLDGNASRRIIELFAKLADAKISI